MILEGSLDREKVLKLVEMVELLEGVQEAPDFRIQENSTFADVYNLIENKFAVGSFTSPDILEAYEDTYGKTIRLSTVSTYLARFNEKNILNREKKGSGWAYRRTRLLAKH